MNKRIIQIAAFLLIASMFACKFSNIKRNQILEIIDYCSEDRLYYKRGLDVSSVDSVWGDFIGWPKEKFEKEFEDLGCRFNYNESNRTISFWYRNNEDELSRQVIYFIVQGELDAYRIILN